MTVHSEQRAAPAARPQVAGVTVLTTRSAGDVFGVTVSGYTAVCVSPLLVVASVGKDSPLLGMLRESRVFALSMLASHQQAVASHFASADLRPESGGFARVAATAKHTGSPVVHGCLSWFDCELDALVPGEDHCVLVGSVVAAGSGAGEPLVAFAGGFGALDDALIEDGFAGSAPTRSAPTGSPPTSRTPADEPDSSGSDAADAMGLALHLLGPDATDVIEACRSVGAALTSLAARRGDAEHWDAMEAVIEAAHGAAQAADLNAGEAAGLGRALDDTVAELIAAAAANRVLAVTHRGLRRAQAARGDAGRGLSAAVAGSRGLLKALRAGDGAAAAALMSDVPG